ncbi:MAG: Y-family DNA polymerase [Lentisphaeria bacterium]|nr:Y-family DNA polymerase [Lentisphaeria bacterium]
MIGLIDGNNFFVSCERIFDPTLENRPVAVLSNNDGCCISRSNEFKALGIAMGTPYFQLRPLISRYGLVLRSSNYELYSDISHRIISLLHRFSPDVEQYSIDEAFIHLELPSGSDYFKFGTDLRSTILKWIGVPCGVGFAPTRTLAKIANHIGKKSPQGVFVMPQESRSILENTPVEEVWGVGRKLAPKLNSSGIRNAWQLACQDVSAMSKKHSILLGKTILELRGINALDERDPEELSQSISCSRCFGSPVTEFDDLAESIASYTATAAEKLRKENQTAQGMSAYFVMYPEHNALSPMPGAVNQVSVIFPAPTDETAEMMKAIRPLLKSIFHQGRRYKKSGMMFFGLESKANCQLDLFDAPAKDNSELYRIIDELNSKYGKGTIFSLGEGVKKPWKMKRDMLSQSYTTNWEQLLKVKC